MKETEVLDILKKILEIMQTFDDYVSYKLMLFLIFMSSALLIPLKIESTSIILSDMKIEGIAIIMFSIGVSGIAYKICIWMLGYVIKKCCSFLRVREEKGRRAESTAQMRETLHSLTTGEAGILKYMIRTGGVKWLPIENVSVLGLMEKGLLRAITRISTYRGRNYHGSAQCISFVLSGSLHDYIKLEGKYILPEWDEIPEADKMCIYQEDEDY